MAAAEREREIGLEWGRLRLASRRGRSGGGRRGSRRRASGWSSGRWSGHAAGEGGSSGEDLNQRKREGSGHAWWRRGSGAVVVADYHTAPARVRFGKMVVGVRFKAEIRRIRPAVGRGKRGGGRRRRGRRGRGGGRLVEEEEAVGFRRLLSLPLSLSGQKRGRLGKSKKKKKKKKVGLGLGFIC